MGSAVGTNGAWWGVKRVLIMRACKGRLVSILSEVVKHRSKSRLCDFESAGSAVWCRNAVAGTVHYLCMRESLRGCIRGCGDIRFQPLQVRNQSKPPLRDGSWTWQEYSLGDWISSGHHPVMWFKNMLLIGMNPCYWLPRPARSGSYLPAISVQ